MPFNLVVHASSPCRPARNPSHLEWKKLPTILDAIEEQKERKRKKLRDVKQICRSLDTAKKELLGNRGISGSGEKG